MKAILLTISSSCDPQTRLFSAWRFTIYKLRPIEAVITRGQAVTGEEAEAQARKIVANLQRSTESAA
jgi:hypothetical protein